MIRKTLLFVFIVAAAAINAHAQTYFGISYEPSTPLGEMRDFTVNSSLRGLNGNASRYLNEHFSVGINVQWTGFYEKDERHTWKFEGGGITATAWKEFYIITLYANARYHFKTEEEARLLPYVGLNVGTAYVEQNLQISDYEYKFKYWKFAFAPEAGTLIPMGMEKSWGFDIKLRYQVFPYNENDIGLMHFLNYSFGVYWKIYPRGEDYY